ncbi:MAG TPA: hypothetical protein DCS93_20630 [Microscillaceae bacterium]|nr:hypothetical protein [Microscillaceae bacterium]
MKTTNNILIYGANGFTGKLLTQYLIKQGKQPILAGRSTKVEALGKMWNCPVRIFEAKDAIGKLADIEVLVNVAGPFSRTQSGLIEACIEANVHYIDVAGEYTDMLNVYRYHETAQQAGIKLLPAAGIFSVPMDIVAKLASLEVVNPTHLTIGFASEGKPSRGSLNTALKKIQDPGHVLVEGVYKKALPGRKLAAFNIFGKLIKTAYHPWRADLFTAQLSTNVQNIETYSAFPAFVVKMMHGKLNWLRKLILNRLIRFLPEGPNEKQIKKGKIYAKAIAKNANNEIGIAEMRGPDAYQFTVSTIAKLIVLSLDTPRLNGFITPSQFGTEWIKEIEGVETKAYQLSDFTLH